MSQKFLTIIPARLASTRLPNKPLADILGKSMIQRVYEQAVKADIGPVYIACDGQKIADEIEKFGGNYVITDPDLPSGTDRVHAALEQIEDRDDYDVVLNVQGDLPAIDPEVIAAAGEALVESGADIGTIASIIKNDKEVADSNVVKIAISFDRNPNLGQGLYFSRSPIPHGKGDYYHHIGIYAYTKDALNKFVFLSSSGLEKRESLEQLRALENNMKIAVKIVDSHPLSVDTKEDLEEIKRFIEGL